MTVPPEEVIDCLLEDWPGAVEPVRWSEYLPDGLLADLLAAPANVDAEHREFETLERVGGWGAGHCLGTGSPSPGDDLV